MRRLSIAFAGTIGLLVAAGANSAQAQSAASAPADVGGETAASSGKKAAKQATKKAARKTTKKPPAKREATTQSREAPPAGGQAQEAPENSSSADAPLVKDAATPGDERASASAASEGTPKAADFAVQKEAASAAPSEAAPAADKKRGAKPSSEQKASAGAGGGFSIGLRTGFGIPFGEAEAGSDLSVTTTGKIPLWVDFGYYVASQWMLGAYFQYGYPFVGRCTTGATCTANDVRLGIQGQFHLMPAQSVDPWFGLSLGYELFWGSAEGATDSYDVEYSGWEYINVHAGTDFALGSVLAAGPFVSFSVSEYTSGTRTVDRSVGDIESTTLHHWLLFGARGAFGF